MKDLKQFIKTTIRDFLNENKNISQRIDNALGKSRWVILAYSFFIKLVKGSAHD